MSSRLIKRKLTAALPRALTRRPRSFCTGRPRVAPSEPDSPRASAGIKVLEVFREEFEFGSGVVTLETGKLARFANGAVFLGMGDTRVLSTVTSRRDDAAKDFLPVTVDYIEKQFAQGVIPGTFTRREGPPKERELLSGRIADRAIRPLFPAGFYDEVQITEYAYSSDGKQDPNILAANATSGALMLSDIPWGGPIGFVRIGRIHGQYVVNPTMDELYLSDLNLVYACTKDKTLMMDVEAREISERDFKSALRLAHPEAVKCLEPQIRLAAKAGKHKKEYKLSMMTDRTFEKVGNMAEAEIEAVFTDASYGKFERGAALDKIMQDVKKRLEEEGDEEILKVLPKAIDTVRKQVVRKRILAEGSRVDGRSLDEVRPLHCEAGILPILHGSSLFSRGETQVLCTVTLGAPGDAQRLQSLVGPSKKQFMLHYNFPPFCINEVGKRGGLNRREVGHGGLAEKALLGVLPPEDTLPYTIRVNSEVMASDGSTSMASVCGGSMALMDAGVPLRDHVAGISIGLVSEVDQLTGEMKDYCILTDILGLEDHLGDMDFKIAGTRNGITAIQLDMKPAGIPLDIICECLEPALKGRIQILDRMEEEIRSPRIQYNKNAPRLATLKFSNETLRRLIGPQGVLKRKIEEETGARLSISDGTLTIVAKNQAVMDNVQEKIDFQIGRELEVGGVYKGIVTSIKEYGAFIEFNGGQQGLLHISELSHRPVSKISDLISVGQQLSLLCIGQDVRGNVKLSLKATLPIPESDTEVLVEGSAPVSVGTPLVQVSVEQASDAAEEQKPLWDESKGNGAPVRPSLSSSSAVIIRSVEECDEEEKASGFNRVPESHSKPTQGSKRNSDEENTASGFNQVPESHSKPTQASKRNSKGSRSKSSSRLPKVAAPTAEKVDEKEKPSVQCQILESQSKSPGNSKKKSKQNISPSLDGKKAKVDASLGAKNLKIGTKRTANVYQVRTHGLVLDLGGEVRGMYRFEENGRRDFNVGDKLQVKCTSFSTKGIPIMSLVRG